MMYPVSFVTLKDSIEADVCARAAPHKKYTSPKNKAARRKNALPERTAKKNLFDTVATWLRCLVGRKKPLDHFRREKFEASLD